MGTRTWLASAAIAVLAGAAAASASAHTSGSIYFQVGPPVQVAPATPIYPPAPPVVRPYSWGAYPAQPYYGGAYGPGYERGWHTRYRRDRDHDGIPDRWDRDLDNDGRPNHRDWDRDGDGVPNRYDRRPNNPYRY